MAQTTSLAALERRGRELRGDSGAFSESYSLRGPDLRVETSASGSVPAQNEDFTRQLAALQRSTTGDLSGSDAEEVDLPDTDVHLRALAQRYSARASEEAFGRKSGGYETDLAEGARFQGAPAGGSLNLLLVGGAERSLAESATNLEDLGGARARSPAKRIAEIQGLSHFSRSARSPFVGQQNPRAK